MMRTVATWPEGGAAVPADEHLVEQLYRREGRRLLGMLTAYLGDRSEAEDVLQESFARVQRARHRIEDPERAAAYLRTTAFNTARSSLRRRRRPAVVEWAEHGDVDVAPYTADDVERRLVLREDQRAVLRALGALPPRQRACVILRYYDSRTIEEVAATLDISANSVKTHLRRAKAALETSLEETR
jgi:RNA polymerase sigma factor (sigma-70 family)